MVMRFSPMAINKTNVHDANCQCYTLAGQSVSSRNLRQVILQHSGWERARSPRARATRRQAYFAMKPIDLHAVRRPGGLDAMEISASVACSSASGHSPHPGVAPGFSCSDRISLEGQDPLLRHLACLDRAEPSHRGRKRRATCAARRACRSLRTTSRKPRRR